MAVGVAWTALRDLVESKSADWGGGFETICHCPVFAVTAVAVNNILFPGNLELRDILLADLWLLCHGKNF